MSNQPQSGPQMTETEELMNSVRSLHHIIEHIGVRPLLDGTNRTLKDISLQEATEAMLKSSLYRIGELHERSTAGYVDTLKILGFQPKDSLEKIAVGLGNKATFLLSGNNGPRSLLNLVFGLSGQLPSEVAMLQGVALMEHIVRVCSEVSELCHKEFDDTNIWPLPSNAHRMGLDFK